MWNRAIAFDRLAASSFVYTLDSVWNGHLVVAAELWML